MLRDKIRGKKTIKKEFKTKQTAKKKRMKTKFDIKIKIKY